MPDAILLLGGTLIGGLIGAGGTLGSVWIRSRFEERKQHQELVFRAGIESYKRGHELLRHHKGVVHLYPFETHLIHMALITKVIAGNDLTGESIIKELDHVNSISDKVVEYYKLRSEEHASQQTKCTDEEAGG